MMDMSQNELIEAIHALGDGHHKLKDIENMVVKMRHDKKRTATKARKKKS